MKFYELAVGAVFTRNGRLFRKTAPSMAEDDRCWGVIFRPEAEVVSDGPLATPQEAEKWKPGERHWTEYLGPAPGQVERGRQ